MRRQAEDVGGEKLARDLVRGERAGQGDRVLEPEPADRLGEPVDLLRELRRPDDARRGRVADLPRTRAERGHELVDPLPAPIRADEERCMVGRSRRSMPAGVLDADGIEHVGRADARGFEVGGRPGDTATTTALSRPIARSAEPAAALAERELEIGAVDVRDRPAPAGGEKRDVRRRRAGGPSACRRRRHVDDLRRARQPRDEASEEPELRTNGAASVNLPPGHRPAARPRSNGT